MEYVTLNPFLTEEKILFKIKENHLYSVDNINIKDVLLSEFIDNNRYAKVYDKLLDKLLDKDIHAWVKLFFYICKELVWEQDMINIPYGILDFSKNMYYDSINKLIELNIIRKYKKEKYWVNPFLLFKGNRLRKYNAYIKSNPDGSKYLDLTTNKNKDGKNNETIYDNQNLYKN